MPKPKIAKPPAENRVSLRIDLASGQRIGPGKIAVLEAIDRMGSISAAGRTLGMSYRRTWALVEALNHCAALPAVQTAAGGAGGGGAALTETGHAIIRCYRAVETEAMRAILQHLDADPFLSPPPAPPP
jgi:molybdate transport system regulatory protein